MMGWSGPLSLLNISHFWCVFWMKDWWWNNRTTLKCNLFWNSGEVTAPAGLTAPVGLPVLLSCNVSITPDDIVRQVRWLDRHSRLLLAYEQRDPVHVSHQDANVQLAASHADGSTIRIKRLRPEDEGCYRCVFDIFPSGRQEGKTCVSVTGQFSFEKYS